MPHLHITAVLIGNTAACIAAVAAAISLYFARQTVREAKAARLDSEAARRDAVAERREAERERHRRRLERIGELVGDVQITVGIDLYRARSLLRAALVGFGDQLPRCAAIVNAGTDEQAHAAVAIARDEVEIELQRLHQDELAAQHEETQASQMPAPPRVVARAWRRVSRRRAAQCQDPGDPPTGASR